MSYIQRTPNSCGPDAQFFALHNKVSRESHDKAWGINDIEKFRDFGDTPWNHFTALWKLKIPFELISSPRILAGQAINNQTVILLHYYSPEPEVRSFFGEIARFLKANLNEHWVVLESLGKDCVFVHVGDGTTKGINNPVFEKMVNSGIVRCAYVVGRGKYKLSWYERFWGWMTGKFF